MATKETLQLTPWRDGYEFTKRRLQEQSPNTRTVQVSFSEYDFKEYLQDDDTIRLFEEIGNNPKLESVIVELDVFSELPTSVSIPPIAALTTMLTQSNSQIRDLTLNQLQLESPNDLDINGMVEALRIHPTLQRIQIKNCTFSKPAHLYRLRTTLIKREGIKHCDVLDNRVSYSTEHGEEKMDYEEYWQQEEEKEEWPEDKGQGYHKKKKQSFWSWISNIYPRFTTICLFCLGWMIASLAAQVLEEPATMRNHNHYSAFVSNLPSFPSASNLLLLQTTQTTTSQSSNRAAGQKSHSLLSGMSRRHLFWQKDTSEADGKQPPKRRRGRNKQK